jgi:hypothetical protein
MAPTDDRTIEQARRDEYKAAWAEAFPVSKSGTLEEMAPFFDSPWPGIRGRMLRAVGKRRMVEGVPLLIESAESERDDSVRLTIALALRDLEDPRGADTLWAMVESDPDGTGAGMPALQGLSRLGDDRVIPVALSWYHTRGRSLMEKQRPHAAVFDLVLLRSSSGDKAVAELLATETSWRRRRLIRQAKRRAERWLAQHS